MSCSAIKAYEAVYQRVLETTAHDILNLERPISRIDVSERLDRAFKTIAVAAGRLVINDLPYLEKMVPLQDSLVDFTQEAV
jgi:hypothetical protein